MLVSLKHHNGFTLMKLLQKMKGDAQSLPPLAPTKGIALAGLGGVIAMSLLGLLGATMQTTLVLGSFGASCVLLFGFPDVPFSQPRNIVAGHFLSSLIGLAFLKLLGPSWWEMGLETELSIAETNLSTVAQTIDLIPSITKESLTLIILGALVICILWEVCVPYLQIRSRVRLHSYLINASTFIFNNVTLSLLSVPSLLYVAQSYSHFGLLSAWDDGWLKWVVAFVLLDLTIYLWHAANHRFECLWMFHKVHHSDRTVNVTTGIRFHMGELVLTVLVKSAFIIVIGVNVSVVLVSEAIITLFVLFHHTNVSFRGEWWLSGIVIVPALHRLHHSTRRDEHDNNYGLVFSLWDRLFGTLRDGAPETIGLQKVGEQDFLDLVKFGFTSEREPVGKIGNSPFVVH